jgi:hypothetical protein
VTVALLVDRPQRTTRFRWIALTFVALLAIGLALAVVVHQRFVAYRPVAAEHVPAGSTFAARFDLTHVMLYEPFRRYLFPLADLGSKGRRERLERHGIRLGADLREVVIAVGAEPSDWLLVLGGPVVDREIAATLAAALREEGRTVDARNGAYAVDGALVFAQASDGALLMAAREERLRSALPSRPSPAALGHAAGGLEVTPVWLPPPLRTLSGSYRAGAVVFASLSADLAGGGDEAGARSAMKAVLARVAALDPVLAETVGGASIRVESHKVIAEVSLSSTAAERLAERVAQKVSRAASAP